MEKLNMGWACWPAYEIKLGAAVAWLVFGHAGHERKQMRRAVEAARPLWA